MRSVRSRAKHGRICGGEHLHLRRLGADERENASGRDEDSVHACPLELGDFLCGRILELRNRQLPRGDVVQKLEQDLEWVLLRAMLGREQKDLGIELDECTLEVVRVRDAHDALEPECTPLLPCRAIGRDDHRVRNGRTFLRCAAEM
jgi:hypothetical protein